MQLEEINAIYEKHWRMGFASIAADELMVVQSLIEQERPQSFLEVGMASGISGGVICTMMDENGGETFTTLDHDNTFFADPTKENGYLIEEIYQGSRVKVNKRPFTTALDLPELGMEFDIAFIDANHQHPFPLLDTLCVFPYLRGPRLVLHHDLNLFKIQEIPVGIGPKYLYDQFPHELRQRAAARRGNLYFVRMTMTQDELERMAIDAFHLPWSIKIPIPPADVDKARTVFGAHYSGDLLAAFDGGIRKFNNR